MNKHYSSIVGSFVVSALLVALPVFAENYGPTSASLGVGATTSVKLPGGSAGVQASGQAGANLRTAAIARAKEKADQEIARRVGALNALSTRVNAMVKLSADEKTSIGNSISSQVSTLNDLKTKIDADAAANVTSSLKTDIKSITGSYRIFVLVIPQGAIAAAADRIVAIVGTMNDLGAKLQARITAAQTAGNDTTAAASALVDFNTKVSDANTQAQAAVTETASLTPDQGDQAKLQANEAVLKDARTKIRAAQQDIVAARADAQTIIRAFASFRATASASTSVQ